MRTQCRTEVDILEDLTDLVTRLRPLRNSASLGVGDQGRCASVV